MECSINGCTAEAAARGWCPKHWWRWRNYGTTDIRTVYDMSAEERFWAKVDTSGECWLWTAAKRGDGYGAFQAKSMQQVGAHRYSYELHHGRIPEGMVVMHICDVPLCVNPDHLRLGTNAENCADSALKARRPRGSQNSQSKLTEGQVLELRRVYAAGEVSQKQLAKRFGISHALVSFIVTRKVWKHI